MISEAAIRGPRVPTRLASIKQAAERATVSQRTIYRWLASGDLTGYRVGRRTVRVDLDEVEAMVRTIPAATSTWRRQRDADVDGGVSDVS